jgi:hypothetical protein
MIRPALTRVGEPLSDVGETRFCIGEAPKSGARARSLTNNGAPLARHLLGHGVLASTKLSQSLLKTIFLGRYFARQD